MRRLHLPTAPGDLPATWSLLLVMALLIGCLLMLGLAPLLIAGR